ncbi:hypothetical protein VTL71DRAFT_1229 [Oculimacula yallundae]|uniref:Uncharacterized protein n=1 Tax=Oculimacula yallundae TaxID=86028 RepID=A0ABR4CAJ5_9HELO
MQHHCWFEAENWRERKTFTVDCQLARTNTVRGTSTFITKMQEYTCSPPVDCGKEVDASHLKGKTVVVTGGANGIGEAYVRALNAAGLNVCIGDMDVKGGTKLANELRNVKFVKCDVSNWEDQVELFKTAASFTGKVDYVVANAGIAPPDEVFDFAGKDNPPTKPNLATLNVNLTGALYTTKLATHYFISQNGQSPFEQKQEDTCLVLIGSGAAFLDCLRGPTYPATKWAMRGIMHSLRRTAGWYGSRVNVISPWYVRTNILSEEAFDAVSASGVSFAQPEDAGRCLLRILSDPSMNGKSLFLSPRKWAPNGFLDLDLDDYPGNELLQEIQREQICTDPVEKGLFLK